MYLYNFYSQPGEKDSGYRWFKTLVILIILLSAFYIAVHKWGYLCLSNVGDIRIEYLNKEQTETLTRILDLETDTCDSLKNDSIRNMLRLYVHSCFPDLDMRYSSQLDTSVIKKLSIKQLKIILPQYPLKLRSYFWLYQNWVYFEIVLWCLFGVLANLLYNTAENLRLQNFKKPEIYVQIGKLFYSPFCVVIIYLCYNKIQSGDVQNDIRYSVNSIAVSFLLGFFSGRMIDLLNRLKDLLLPLGKGAAENLPPKTEGAKPDDEHVKDESTTTGIVSALG